VEQATILGRIENKTTLLPVIMPIVHRVQVLHHHP
jgi:hypothetical protein